MSDPGNADRVHSHTIHTHLVPPSLYAQWTSGSMTVVSPQVDGIVQAGVSNSEGVQGSSRAVPESVKWSTAGGMGSELAPTFWRRLVAICNAFDQAQITIVEVRIHIVTACVRVAGHSCIG